MTGQGESRMDRLRARPARQAMLGELADVLQTVGNLITAFDITDEELAQSMDDCLVRNQERGRL